MAINEINTNWLKDKSTRNKNFIELTTIGCRIHEKPIMQKYSLIAINFTKLADGTCQSQIEFLVKLYHAKFKENKKYFVIGSEEMHPEKVDLAFSHSSVYSRQKSSTDGQQASISSLFKKTNYRTVLSLKIMQTAVAVILLKAEVATRLPKFVWPATGYIVLEHDDQLWDSIKTMAFDTIVFSQTDSKIECTNHPGFQYLKEIVASDSFKFILPEIDNKQQADKSLNRCPISSHINKRFLYQEFKLGNPTPGTLNDCSSDNFIEGYDPSTSLILEGTEYQPTEQPTENADEAEQQPELPTPTYTSEEDRNDEQGKEK